MMFKVVNYEDSGALRHAYAVKQRKRWWHLWKYVRDNTGRVTHWRTVMGAKTYISQEKKRNQNNSLNQNNKHGNT
jgi:hypothetical protein